MFQRLPANLARSVVCQPGKSISEGQESGESGRVRMAIQRSGRLADGSRSLLEQCGLSLVSSKNNLVARADGLPLDLLLVRDDDIPAFVAGGVCDIGVVGLNVLHEALSDESIAVAAENPARLSGCLHDDSRRASLRTLLPLGFGACRLMIAVPLGFDYHGLSSLNGQRIATSHPRILHRWLGQNNLDAVVVTMHGSVEIAPHLGLSDVICDLVATGQVLQANGLRPVHTVLSSQAALIARADDSGADGTDVNPTLGRLLQRMEGVVAAKGCHYVMLNAPAERLEEIRCLLPGARAPTVLSLAGNDKYVAVHAVCQEAVFWEAIEALRDAGACDILVMPIQKMLD